MSPDTPTRDDAWRLLTEFNEAERTLKHALAVEAVMRHMAAKMAATWTNGGLSG